MKRISILVMAFMVLFSCSAFAIRHTPNTQWEFIAPIYADGTNRKISNDYLNVDSMIMDKDVLYFEIKSVNTDEELEYERTALKGYDTSGIKRVRYTIYAYNINSKKFHPVTDDRRFYLSDDVYTTWKSVNDDSIAKLYCDKALPIYVMQNIDLSK